MSRGGLALQQGTMRWRPALVFVSARAARACTVCDTATAHAVRRGIFQDHFVERAVLVLLPFAAFVLVGLLLYFAMPVSRRAEMP